MNHERNKQISQLLAVWQEHHDWRTGSGRHGGVGVSQAQAVDGKLYPGIHVRPVGGISFQG